MSLTTPSETSKNRCLHKIILGASIATCTAIFLAVSIIGVVGLEYGRVGRLMEGCNTGYLAVFGSVMVTLSAFCMGYILEDSPSSRKKAKIRTAFVASAIALLLTLHWLVVGAMNIAGKLSPRSAMWALAFPFLFIAFIC